MNGPATVRRRTGYLSDASIMEQCPTNFAQTGTRTYGLIKIDGAPNEMSQRPFKAAGLINNLSNRTGVPTGELTERYVESINNLPLNPMIVIPSDPNNLGAINIASPMPTSSRPRTVALTAGQISRLGWKSDVNPTRATMLSRALARKSIRLAKAEEGSTAEIAPSIAPFASPVENLDELGSEPIIQPTITTAPDYLLDQIKPKRTIIKQVAQMRIPRNLLPPTHPDYDPTIAPMPNKSFIASPWIGLDGFKPRGKMTASEFKIFQAAQADASKIYKKEERSDERNAYLQRAHPSPALLQAIADAPEGATFIPRRGMRGRERDVMPTDANTLEPSRAVITDRNVSTAAMREQTQLYTQTRSDGQSGSSGQGTSADTNLAGVE